jgi:hypothetical protein
MAGRGFRSRTETLALVASFAIVLSGCASTPAASVSPGPTAGPSSEPVGEGSQAPVASVSPSVPPVASVAPTPAPTPPASSGPTSEPTETPSPTPTQAPVPAGWSTPARVTGSAACGGSMPVIDATGKIHVVAQCGKDFMVFLSGSGGSWTSTTLAPPAGKTDASPQIAVDGGTTYIAYQEYGDGGCGDAGYASVYVRSQSTPGGAWSAPAKIGATKDGLQSFLVKGGTIYATVLNDNTTTWFETVKGATTHRYKIADARPEGSVSLQVGTDNLARIAYWGTAGIRYGVFNGTGFSTATVYKEDGFAWGPVLELDSTNHPRIIWTHSPEPGGCAIGGGTSKDGEYYATLSGSSWTSRRITTDTGGCSFVRDDATGLVTMVTGDFKAVDLYTKPGASWQRTILSTLPSSLPTLVIQQATGTITAVFDVDPFDNPTAPGIYTMTRSGS